jgi:hypothetical protein
VSNDDDEVSMIGMADCIHQNTEIVDFISLF